MDYDVELRNSIFLDIASLFLLVFFAITDPFFPTLAVLPYIALALVIIHTVRLAGWYTYCILKYPLLWILFAGYIILILGFALRFLASVTQVVPAYSVISLVFVFSYFVLLFPKPIISCGLRWRKACGLCPLVNFCAT